MAPTSVRDHYQAHGLQEWRRLVKNPFHRLEFDTTMHFLERHLPPSGRVLDAGGGPGRYTIEFAKRGYDIVLFDTCLSADDQARPSSRTQTRSSPRSRPLSAIAAIIVLPNASTAPPSTRDDGAR